MEIVSIDWGLLVWTILVTIISISLVFFGIKAMRKYLRSNK